MDDHSKPDNPHDIIVAALRRMSVAGESHEMAARWIMEDLAARGFQIFNEEDNYNRERDAYDAYIDRRMGRN